MTLKLRLPVSSPCYAMPCPAMYKYIIKYNQARLSDCRVEDIKTSTSHTAAPNI